MRDTDKIAGRVQAARASLVHQDAQHERKMASLSREIFELKESMSKQNAVLDGIRADNERMQIEKLALVKERRRYKELLMSLLAAVEGRKDGKISGYTEDLAQAPVENLAQHGAGSAFSDDQLGDEALSN